MAGTLQLFNKILLMTIQQIAARLVELCRKGEFEEAQSELYADDIVSIEPFATKDFEKETRGLAAVIEKARKFDAMVEQAYLYTVSEPLVAPHSIAFILTMDIKMKGRSREVMTELCVYEVKDEKITSEHFFL